MNQVLIYSLATLTVASAQIGGTLLCVSAANAHGANVRYQSTQAIQIVATYDTGQPMATAQVTIYAPNNPATPWQKGTTDEQGRFTFTPDASVPGNWAVQVRQAGHGVLIDIPLEQAEAANAETTVQMSAGTPNFTPAQKGIMTASVIWGFVGTALFFSRRGKHAHS